MLSTSRLPVSRAALATLLASLLLSPALAGPPTPALGGPPDLPDLNVTHISRTPRYPAYVLKYEQLPGSGPEAMPQVADPQTGQAVTPEQAAKIKRWPDPGEEVTFQGMVCNHGTRPTGPFGYRWYIDENVVAEGKHDSLDGPSLMTDEYEEAVLGGEKFKLAKRVPGTYCTLEYKWKWQPGRHYVRLDVDGDDQIDEICEVNNSVLDATDACAFVIMVDAYTYNELAKGENHWKSYNFEDIVKYHREQMHRKFRASIHPLTPNGVREEIRYDAILVQPAGEQRDRIGGMCKLAAGWDSHWDFTGYVPREGTSEQKTWYFKSQDWGLPHELGHQLGLIDLYCLDTEGGDGGNYVKDASGDPILLSHFTGEQCMMRGHGDRNFGEHSAMALNMQLGRRRGYFGDYLWSLPARNTVRILDAEGKPVDGVALTFYQHRGRYIPNEVVFKGTTNQAGEFELPNRDCLSFTTDRGFTLRPNPFGQLNVVGTNGVFFVIAQARGYTDYLWLPITELNLAYWRGQKDAATFDLASKIPGTNTPPAVEGLQQVTVDGGAVELRWKQRQADETYTVYVRANAPPRWAVARDGEKLTAPVYRVPDTGRYGVVEVRDGRESAFPPDQRVLLLRDPRGIALDDKGRRIVRDLGYSMPVAYRTDGGTIGIFGTFHMNVQGGGDIARTADGRLLLTSDDAQRGLLRVLDADGFPIPGRERAGAPGNGPLQFNKPTGVTVDTKGRVWIADTGNGRVQVLDPKMERMLAQAGAECGLKAPMKVAELPGGERFAVADPEAAKVVILRFDGSRLEHLDTPVTGVRRPVYVACSAKELFVSDEGAEGAAGASVHAFAIEGDAFRLIAAHRLAGVSATGAEQHREGVPAGLVYDAKQNVLVVVDRVNRRLQAMKVGE
jgi:hypothetical protein